MRPNPASPSARPLKKPRPVIKAEPRPTPVAKPEPSKRARLEQGRAEELMTKIESESVDLVLADPPYSIDIADWDKFDDYVGFSKRWIREAVRVLRPGGGFLIYGSPERTWLARILLLCVDDFKLRHVQTLVWAYTQGGDARLGTMQAYAVRHEELLWLEKPASATQKRTFNAAAIADQYTEAEIEVALKKGVGRVTREALERGKPPITHVNVPRENSRSKERRYGKHPSMKPLALCERLIRAHSNENDAVVVPFAGSGSELLVATKLGRRAVGFEIANEFVELMTKRFVGHGVPLETVSSSRNADTDADADARPDARTECANDADTASSL